LGGASSSERVCRSRTAGGRRFGAWARDVVVRRSCDWERRCRQQPHVESVVRLDDACFWVERQRFADRLRRNRLKLRRVHTVHLRPLLSERTSARSVAAAGLSANQRLCVPLGLDQLVGRSSRRRRIGRRLNFACGSHFYGGNRVGFLHAFRTGRNRYASKLQQLGSPSLRS
jgi:hypothetical protein